MQKRSEEERKGLYRQLIAMEETIGKLQSQQIFLASAITSLGSLWRSAEYSEGKISI